MQVIKEMEQQPTDRQASLSHSDVRSKATSGKGASVDGYNVQTAADAQHHLIITHETTNIGHDRTVLAETAGSLG